MLVIDVAGTGSPVIGLLAGDTRASRAAGTPGALLINQLAAVPQLVSPPRPVQISTDRSVRSSRISVISSTGDLRWARRLGWILAMLRLRPADLRVFLANILIRSSGEQRFRGAV